MEFSGVHAAYAPPAEEARSIDKSRVLDETFRRQRTSSRRSLSRPFEEIVSLLGNLAEMSKWKHCSERVYTRARETLEIIFSDRLRLGSSGSDAAQLRAYAEAGRGVVAERTHRCHSQRGHLRGFCGGQVGSSETLGLPELFVFWLEVQIMHGLKVDDRSRAIPLRK